MVIEKKVQEEDTVEEWIIHAQNNHMKENEIIHTLIKRGFSNEKIREYFPYYKPVEQKKYFMKHLIVFAPLLIFSIFAVFSLSNSSLGVIGAVLAILFISSYEYLKYYKYIKFNQIIVLAFNALIISNVVLAVVLVLIYILAFSIFGVLRLYHIIFFSGFAFMIYGIIYSLSMKFFTNKFTHDRIRYGFVHMFKHIMVLVVVTLIMIFSTGAIINNEIGDIAKEDVYADMDVYLLDYTCNNFFDTCRQVPSQTGLDQVNYKYEYCKSWWDCERKNYRQGSNVNNYYNYLFLVNEGKDDSAIFAVPKEYWRGFINDSIVNSNLDIPYDLKVDLNDKFNEIIEEKEFPIVNDPVKTVFSFEDILVNLTEYQFKKIKDVLMLNEFQKISTLNLNTVNQNNLKDYDELIDTLKSKVETEKDEEFTVLPIDVSNIRYSDKLLMTHIYENIRTEFPSKSSAKLELVEYLKDTEDDNENQESKIMRLALANKIADTN